MLDIIRNGSTVDLVLYFISTVIVVFLTLPIHEFAHAFTANKLGDPTAKYSGRITLNPFAHLDPIGSLMILLFGFGWAKPVPVNSFNFRKPKRDMAITAAAGPLSNLILAFTFYFLYKFLARFALTFEVIGYLALICSFVVQINVSLAVFNLLPIPPLDGSRLIFAFLKDKHYYNFLKYERYFSFAIIFLLFTDVLDLPLTYLTIVIYKLFDILTFWI